MWIVLFLILLARQSSGLKYKFVIDNFEIFDSCPNKPETVHNFSALFDSSNLSIPSDGNKISVSGNVTYLWNIQHGDRVEISYQLFRFDRIGWLQTPFGITVPDICPILYDEPQYWYKIWLQYVANKEDVKDSCFYPGTIMVFEPFEIELILDLTGLPLNGRHKIVIELKAFDSMNIQRETSLCSELIGEFERL